MEASRKLMAQATTMNTAEEALNAIALQDDAVPWDVVKARLAELLHFLASAFAELMDKLKTSSDELFGALARLARGAATVVFPAALVIVLLVCCCCYYFAGPGRAGRRARGPNGEEAAAGWDGPVMKYTDLDGGYKGGIFSMHPNKPIVH